MLGGYVPTRTRFSGYDLCRLNRFFLERVPQWLDSGCRLDFVAFATAGKRNDMIHHEAGTRTFDVGVGGTGMLSHEGGSCRQFGRRLRLTAGCVALADFLFQSAGGSGPPVRQFAD